MSHPEGNRLRPVSDQALVEQLFQLPWPWVWGVRDVISLLPQKGH